MPGFALSYGPLNFHPKGNSMKRLILAAAALGAATAFAQAPAGAPPVEVPKPKCEDPGPYPGRVGMQTEDRRNRFVKAVEAYRNCMVAFVEQRKATVEANQTAAKAAVEELNARIKKINEEQAAAN
jgi:hypothetical protein